jgi:hypothetical protein
MVCSRPSLTDDVVTGYYKEGSGGIGHARGMQSAINVDERRCS